MRPAPLTCAAGVAVAVCLVAAGSARATSPTTPFLPPVVPIAVVAPFDEPAARWLPGHRGVDVAATAGADVRSPAAGVVSFAGVVVDRPVVSVDHGGIRTTYEPVTARVERGQQVTAGQVLGIVADGGHCSQRCVHWGAIVDERYVDPLALLIDYRPVLKPPR